MRLLDRIIPASSRSLDTTGFGFDPFETFAVGGNTYTLPVQTTWPGNKSEPISNSFIGYALGGLMSNAVIFGLSAIRVRVFSEARFQYQAFNKGRPGDLYGNQDLGILETPWPGGTTGDLLAIALLHADYAGNAYITNVGGQLVALRPDWTDIILGDRNYQDGTGTTSTVGLEKLGYRYRHGGPGAGYDPVFFLPEDVAHFAPMPDPLAWYRGMSWLTPVIREIQVDGVATTHKLKFFENAATPNLAVSLSEIRDPKKFSDFVDMMNEKHSGASNAYKTLYLGAGADVTVIGSDLARIDFKNLQGFGETRMALAAGVPPTVACLSEGLQGSSLNAGNFGQARRQFADTTLASLWRNMAGSMAVLVPPPGGGNRLWYDARDIPFLREDQKDQSEILMSQAHTIRQLIDAGFEPSSVVRAVTGNDFALLVHTGLFSIQLQEAGSPKLPEPAATTGVAKNFDLDDPEWVARFVEIIRPAELPRVRRVHRDDWGRILEVVDE